MRIDWGYEFATSRVCFGWNVSPRSWCCWEMVVDGLGPHLEVHKAWFWSSWAACCCCCCFACLDEGLVQMDERKKVGRMECRINLALV